MSRRGAVVLLVLAVVAAGIAFWLLARSPAVDAPTADVQDAAKPKKRRPPRPRRFGQLSLPEVDVAEDDATYGAISGVVLDWDTGAPVAGAEITFLSDGSVSSAISDPTGNFVFVAAAAGTFDLASVFADGYQPYAPEFGQSPVRFVARPGRRVSGVQIYLVPVIEIVGRVLSQQGEAAAGAIVRVLGADAGESALADAEATYTTDDAGEFRFSAGLGTWLEARHATLGGGREEVDERVLAARVFSITLSPDVADADGELGGVVLDPRGQPLAGARVVAGASAFLPSAETVTDDEGAFTIDDLVPGSYRVEASHRDYAPVWTPKLPTGSMSIRLQLAVGGTIEGTIRGEDDAAVSGATVVAMRHTGGMMRVQQARVTVFDADGSYRVTGLPPGLYDVAGAAHGRGVAKVLEVDVGTGAVTVDLRLPSGVNVTGRVVDEDSGSPLPAARVELERHVGRGPSIAPIVAAALTDENGEFELRGVEAGRHSVTAYALGHVGRTLSGVEVEAADVGPLRFELSADGGDGWSFDFAGIGVSISASRVDLEVKGVLEGGGAEKAGVLLGDRIVAVDGIPVREYDFTGAVEALRGVEGTEVLLTITRGDEELELTALRYRVRI